MSSFLCKLSTNHQSDSFEIPSESSLFEECITQSRGEGGYDADYGEGTNYK